MFLSIGRPPGPEMEYCTDRESYSLAAGLALGMVCLGVSSLSSPAFTQSICTLKGTLLTLGPECHSGILSLHPVPILLFFLDSFSKSSVEKNYSEVGL